MLEEIEVSTSKEEGEEESVREDFPTFDCEGDKDCVEEDVHIPDSDCFGSDMIR